LGTRLSRGHAPPGPKADVDDDPHRPTPVVGLAPGEHSPSLSRVIVETEPEARAVPTRDAPSIAPALQSA